jgi:hypothetical protein
MNVTREFGGRWATLARASVAALGLLGCRVHAGSEPRADVDYQVVPDADLSGLTVTACSRSSRAFRRWAAPWSRLTLLEGARVGERLHTSARGCVAYHAALPPSRRTLVRSGALVGSHAEWLLRPTGDVGDVRVRFSLPPGARVATPWPPTRDVGGARAEPTFTLPPRALELPADVLLGRFELSQRDVGGTALQVARVAGTLAHSQAELTDHIAGAVRLVASVGGSFPSERVLAVVWPAPSDELVQFGLTKRGGGASMLLFFGDRAPAGSLAEDWVTVHELAHLLHPRVPPSDRWLSEGIATYYQEVLRARGGWQTPAQAWARIAQGFAAARGGGTGRSLEDEARSMHASRAYTRVYWDGAAFALAADMRLRAQGTSLDEVIARGLRGASRGARPVAASRLVASYDPGLVALAQEHAARAEWAPTDALFEALGVAYSDGEARLVAGPASDVRDAIMGGPDGASPGDR